MVCTNSRSRIRTFLNLTSLGLGNTVGVGIYVLLGELTRNLAGPSAAISILISGIAAILSGLCFAEFGTRFVKADTVYSYSYAYHGENIAFILGWALALEFVAGASSIAKGIITFVDALAENKISNFLKDIVPLNPELGLSYLDFFSPLIILLLIVAITCGLKDLTIVRNIFTGFMLLSVISIIVAGSFKADLINWNLNGTSNLTNLAESLVPFGHLGVLKGAAVGFYGFLGFDTMAVSGREINNPQMCIPFANQITICLVMMVYAGITVILTLISPYKEHILGAALPLAFEKIGWVSFEWITIFGAFFGFYTSLLGVTLPLSRLLNAMANDGLIFRRLGNGCFSGKAPRSTIIVGGILTFFATAIFPFKILVELTIVAALFVFIILAIDIIILRYAPFIDSSAGNPSDNVVDLPVVPKVDVTLPQLIKLLCPYSSVTPNEVTKKVVAVNLLLFCLTSAGLAVVITLFNESLLSAAVEAVLPVVIFVMVILISVVSISCQPKSQTSTSFKVPLVPFVPCLGIFLDIMLIILISGTTILYFIAWMLAGIIPHFCWYSFKYWRGFIGSNSLYEINRLNSVKLNESIWKINSDKKSFYEGAVNPVFQDDEGEETFAQLDQAQEKPVQDQNAVDDKNELSEKKSVVKIKEVSEVISLEVELRESEETPKRECVAEIHMEEVNAEDSYEVQVVNNTYNFLSQVEDKEYGKEEGSSTSSGAIVRVLEEGETAMGSSDSFKISLESSDKVSGGSPENQALEKRSIGRNSAVSSSEIKENGNQKMHSEGEKEDLKNEKQLPKNGEKTLESFDKKESEDQVKAFKDKLNVLLKNQINMNDTLKEALSKYRKNTDECWEDIDLQEKVQENLPNRNIKTLNKSQMKNTLEILLAKGPPKRFSLRKSFSAKITTSSEEESKKN